MWVSKRENVKMSFAESPRYFLCSICKNKVSCCVKCGCWLGAWIVCYKCIDGSYTHFCLTCARLSNLIKDE